MPKDLMFRSRSVGAVLLVIALLAPAAQPAGAATKQTNGKGHGLDKGLACNEAVYNARYFGGPKATLSKCTCTPAQAFYTPSGPPDPATIPWDCVVVATYDDAPPPPAPPLSRGRIVR